MKKVCLIKAGKFFIGIDTAQIISTMSLDDLDAGKIKEKDSVILFLESFLAQKYIERSGSEIIVLKKNKNKGKYSALLIDMTLGEIEFPDRFEPSPLLYPELAAKCCPKIFIHENRVVLMLDPKQLSLIYETLQIVHGLITLDDLMPVKEKIKQKSLPQPDNTDTSDANNETAQGKSKAVSNSETEVEEKIISEIVSWIIDKYNKFYSNEKVIKFYSNETMSMSVYGLPSRLVRQQGLSNKSLQQLIDQTIDQCEKTRYKTMKNMIKDQLNDIL